MREKRIENSATCHCHKVERERNRYFTGKFMTARDFQVDQDYMVTQMRYHNRLFHGWGVVCGLEVVAHPDFVDKIPTDCAWRWIVVKAGVALDCCGRLLVLEHDTAFKLPIQPQKPDGKIDKNGYWYRPFLLCLRYHEEYIEVVPALYTTDECDPQRREANRLRETSVITVCDPEDMPGCWPETDDDPKARCHDDCGDEHPGPAGVCLGTHCVCHDTVPLALITPHEDEDNSSRGYTISMKGRPKLPLTGAHTKIIHTNWPHGGMVPISTLRDKWNGELRLWFDRAIKPAEGYKSGINEFTFVVQHGDLDEDLEFLTPAEHSPSLEHDRCAVFKIDERQLYSRRGDLAGSTLYITLKCDFILDCHNNAVDGNHLGGDLPSGNGTPGGVFMSWCKIIHDQQEEVDPKWQKAA
ncbi:MAG: hypothetical protein R3293_06775 [Candidatus Promineifilaceae bacterium]|nr:hypothetical protein [Candidatus Promineifilaceae bacterium]